MSGAAASLQRRRDVLAQGMRFLGEVWALASIGYAQTTGLDAYGKSVMMPDTARVVAIGGTVFGPRTGQAVRELASFLHTSVPRSGP